VTFIVAAQRFWRTLSDDVTVEAAQAALDAWCALRGDTRMRPGRPGGAATKATITTVADRKPLGPVPAPYPAELSVGRIVSAQALVAFRGNFYSVAPELAGAPVLVSVRLGTEHCDSPAAPGPGRLCSPATGSPHPAPASWSVPMPTSAP